LLHGWIISPWLVFGTASLPLIELASIDYHAFFVAYIYPYPPIEIIPLISDWFWIVLETFTAFFLWVFFWVTSLIGGWPMSIEWFGLFDAAEDGLFEFVTCPF